MKDLFVISVRGVSEFVDVRYVFTVATTVEDMDSY